MTMATSPRDVAEFMFQELQQMPKMARLRQHRLVRQVMSRFGDEYVYRNKNHNYAIAPSVLEVFRELTGDSIVWERSRQAWRHRRDSDPPDSRMVR